MSKPDYPNTFIEENEGLEAVIRRSAWTLTPALLLGGGLIIVDFFLLAWWLQWRGWGLGAFTLIIIVAIVILIRAFYGWRRTVLIVTDRRLIDAEQRGFFYHRVVEAPYEKIQNITYAIKGLWSTIFRFGSIIVETAAQNNRLDLHGLRDPIKIQRLISDVQRRFRQGDSAADLGPEQRRELAGRIVNHPDQR